MYVIIQIDSHCVMLDRQILTQNVKESEILGKHDGKPMEKNL